MFENEIKLITDFNLNKLNNLGNVFTLREIKNCQIHPALVKYILTTIEQQINFDIEKLKRNSPLDYSNEKINNYFNLIKKEIIKSKKFDRIEISEILNMAVSFNINFLTNPNKTLVNFIYSEDDLKTKEEILTGISHIYYYRYLQKILVIHIDKKNILSMRKSEFKSLLNRIDNISKRTYLQESIFTAINSFVNFFDSDNYNPEKFPHKALEIYLNEKGLNEYWYKLKNHFSVETSDYFSGAEVQEIFNLIFAEPEEDLPELNDLPKFFEDQINIPAEIPTVVDENEIISESHNNETKEEKSFDESGLNKFNIEHTELDAQSSNELLKNDENIDANYNSEVSSELKNQSLIEDVKEIKHENYNESMFENSIGDFQSEDVKTDEKLNGLKEKINKPEEVKTEELFNKINSLNVNETENKSELISENNKEIKEETETSSTVGEKIITKPDARKAVDDLINIDELYNNLITVTKPFEDENYIILDNEDFNEFLNSDLKYKIDYSTLSESLSENTDFEDIEAQIEKEEIVYDDRSEIPEQVNLEQYEEKVETVEVNQIDKDNTDILDFNMDSTIDEIVSEKISEGENIYKSDINEDQNIIEAEEKITYHEPLKDEDLKLIEEDDEKTEVFSDMTFLEGNGDDLSPITKEEITDESITDKQEAIVEKVINENENVLPDSNNEFREDSKLSDESNISVIYKTFQDMIKDKDMSSIIENIFDYDMEDYRNTISNISESKNEDEAYRITDNYCKKNHVDQSLKEIYYLKTLITDYFSQPK